MFVVRLLYIVAPDAFSRYIVEDAMRPRIEPLPMNCTQYESVEYMHIVKMILFELVNPDGRLTLAVFPFVGNVVVIFAIVEMSVRYALVSTKLLE